MTVGSAVGHDFVLYNILLLYLLYFCIEKLIDFNCIKVYNYLVRVDEFRQKAGEAQCESAATAITVFEPPHKSGNLSDKKQQSWVKETKK